MAELARNWDDSLPTLCRLGEGGTYRNPKGLMVNLPVGKVKRPS